MIINYLKTIFVSLCLFSFSLAYGTDYFFFIQFTDKDNTPFTLENPSEYLTERALERRRYFRVECDSTDLPVDPAYIEQVKSKGFKVHNITKWFNGITISTPDSISAYSINELAFVNKIEYTGKRTGNYPSARKSRNNMDDYPHTDEGQYGYANDQIEQIKGKYLHNQGYRGKDIHVAILDAGFSKVNENYAYNLLFLQNRLLGTKDFVNKDQDVIYQSHNHGAYVLSIMAADVEYTYIGTAPDASYLLVRTEDTSSEYPVEMDFWISAVEYADSLGIDVINSSLGYGQFDDPTLNLPYEMMTGETTRISKSAELASEKGMIVVISAGNEGNKERHVIGVPADAKGVITVGGVDLYGSPSAFSSYGPSYDGRVKPEISARASLTTILNNDGITASSGTSFSSPVIAGMMASLLQAVKENKDYISLEELFETVYQSADRYDLPDDQLGYGIPDFEKAAKRLLNPDNERVILPEYINIYTDTMSKTLHINLSQQYNIQKTYLQLYSVNGNLIFQQYLTGYDLMINIADYPSGIYALQLINGDENIVSRKLHIY